LVFKLRRQLAGEGAVVPSADLGAVELLGDEDSIVESLKPTCVEIQKPAGSS
jgi:hypothetical protein